MVEVVTVERKESEPAAAAKRRLGHLVASADARLMGLEQALERLSKEDWSLSGMRKRSEALRARARTARDTALQQVDELPGRAMAAAAAAGKARVHDLVRGLRWIEERLQPNGSPPAEGKQAKAG